MNKTEHGSTRVLPPFALKVIEKLQRFFDCAEDFESGGVDIGRDWLDTLTHLGLLERVQRSPALWQITEDGDALLAAPTPPAFEQQRAVVMPEGDEHEDHSASTAAIQFALELEDLEDIPAFLSMWNEGEFETIRRAWPDCPDEVFIGADPLFKPAAPSQGGDA